MSSQSGNGLQDDLIDTIISGLDDSPQDGSVSSHGAYASPPQDPANFDGGLADFDIDMLLAPVITPSVQNQVDAPLETNGEIVDHYVDESTQAAGLELNLASDSDVFNEIMNGDITNDFDEQDLSGAFFDPVFLEGEVLNVEEKPPLTSMSIPVQSNAVSQSQIEKYTADEDSLFAPSEMAMLEDGDDFSLEDAPVNVLTDFSESDAVEVVEDLDNDGLLALDVEPDFPGANLPTDPDLSSNVEHSESSVPMADSSLISSSDFPSIDDAFLPQNDTEPTKVEKSISVTEQKDDGKQKNIDQELLVEMPDFDAITAGAGVLHHQDDGSTFDLGEALGGISAVEDSYTPSIESLVQDGGDADRYHLRLEKEHAQQNEHHDSTKFLVNPGVSEQSEGSQPIERMEQPMTHSYSPEKKRSSISGMAFSVALAVLLSCSGTWWWTTSGPAAQKSAAELSALKSDFDSLKKSINTLQSATKNGDGVTLISAYEALSKKQDELNKEQAQLLVMLKSQSENSAQFEREMIDRFELIVNYAKSVSDQQLLSEQKMRGEIAQTVVSEVNVKTAGIDKSKIASLENELKLTQQRMSEMQKEVKQQAELVSLLEGETDFVRGLLQDYKRKSALTPTAGTRSDPKQPNVSVRPSEKSQNTPSSGEQFSSSLSDFTLIGVHNSGENGFSIFVQSKEDLGTSSYDTYYFKPGETTQIPGYGKILEVQDMPGSAYAVSYQVITERGVIRGRPQ